MEMALFIYLTLDSENSEELIFVMKCLVVSFLFLSVGLIFKALKIIP